ncbi:hypothetical protein BSLG_000248 [Batrachochytrium salamandrivorans]|nr:hypothetical protein BSLG_000248 [Batrachochytrium salamandrivorans]
MPLPIKDEADDGFQDLSPIDKFFLSVQFTNVALESKEAIKVDSGVEIVSPEETFDFIQPGLCVDWFKRTDITLTGIYTRPTVCMLARLSDCTLQIKYCGGNAELPVLSLDYHSIMSFEMSKCGEWRSNTLRPYNFKIVMTIPDNKCAKGDKVLTIWMNELNESVAFAKYVYDTLLDTQKAECKFICHF